MSLDARRIQNPVTQLAQTAPSIAHGSLQPAVAGAVSWRKGKDFGRGHRFALDHGRQLRLAVAGHLVADVLLVALFGRLVKNLALKRVGQVLLGHPMIAVGVGIEVALTVAKAFPVEVKGYQLFIGATGWREDVEKRMSDS